jgi:hypothetical protein
VVKRIAYEEAPEFERPPRTQWEPLVRPLVAGGTLFLPDRTPQSATAGLQSWAVRNRRRVRVQTGRRAGVDGVFVWFEEVPDGRG